MGAAPLGPRRNRRKKAEKISPGTWLLLGAAFFLLTLAVSYWPGLIYRPLNTTGQTQLYLGGKPLPERVWREDGKIYLALAAVKAHLDPLIYWDEKNKLVIVTNPRDVFHFPLDSREALRNLEPYTVESPPKKNGEEPCLSGDLLAALYDVKLSWQQGENIVAIHEGNEPVQTGQITGAARLRVRPGYRAAWTAKIAAGEDVRIFSEDAGWYWVETAGGSMGFIKKSRVKLTDIDIAEKNGVADDAAAFVPWNPLGQQILLAWDFIGSSAANLSSKSDISGVHVLSPTWFTLEEEGAVTDKASLHYVERAHQEGYKVWGVFSNDCKIDLTHTFLNDSALRIKAITQLLEYADKYKLDGLDVDFEYMYLEDKEHYVQFARELAPLLHARGKSLTLYIIFHSDSENWSMCYDHRKLGEIADYLVVMAYDENTVLAGSTASLPWVQRGVARMIEDVPAEKLLLGIPLYTRLWKVTKAEDGTEKTTRQTFTMEQAEKWIAENEASLTKDEKSGQHYVEVRDGAVTYRMWLEDFYSLEKRVEIMKRYRLAGLAVWRRGIEKDGIWTVLANLLNKRW